MLTIYSYIYFRELLFLGVIPRYVELIFSWDILKVVLFTVDFKTKQDLEIFKDSLDIEFRKSNKYKKRGRERRLRNGQYGNDNRIISSNCSYYFLRN